MLTQILSIEHAGRTQDLEYQWLSAERREAPLLVFLHEGLGSVGMWRDYPRRLCEAGGFRGLVYSRPGYGRSTPRPADEHWPATFMHTQACEVLPAFLSALGIDTKHDRPWLFGHSDGGSIALLHAARFPDRVRGVIALAPHLFVEDLSVNSIAKVRTAYLETDLRMRLARYHDDVDSAFWGWNDIWLNPAFRHWNIEADLAGLPCPVLAVQGENDEYGTMAQIESIARLAPQAQLLKLADCGHSPHRDQPDVLTDAVVRFVRGETLSATNHTDEHG
ncbi:MAG: alpha/beta fold hydrolase [Panacagrimonas sp.]